MPASPTATPEHIKDVNTRYHDAAADEYDAKWGIDFGDTGQEQVRLKLVKALGGLDGRGFGDALEIGSGHRLLLAQPGAARRDRAAHRDRHLARDAEAPRRPPPEALGLEGDSTVATEAEELPFEDESFDLVFGHAVLHHIPDLDRAFAEFRRVLRPGGMIAFAGEPSRYGDRLAALPKRAGMLAAPAWRRLVGARRRAVPEAEQSNGHALESEVDVHAFAPADLRRCSATAASRTAASAARSCSPTPGAGACARSSPAPSPNRSPGAGAASPSAATSPCRRSTPACSSPACRPSSSTTCSSPAASRRSRPVPRARPATPARGRCLRRAALAIRLGCNPDGREPGESPAKPPTRPPRSQSSLAPPSRARKSLTLESMPLRRRSPT